MALMHVNFYSEALGFCTSMDVILPQQTRSQIGMDGVADERPYQTLYLLHGMSDDHTIWQRRTNIERYVAPLSLAVVMPAVQLSWYTDMKHGCKYWTFIHEELPAICREFFPLSDKREDNFVAGLSMGGYGAFKTGLCDPEHFGAVASLSGALDAVGCFDRVERDEVFANAFGTPKQFKNSDNDLFAQAEKLKKQKKEQPKMFMWCGTEDFLFEDNERFAEHLTQLGYDFTYTKSPGDHNWACWDEQIQNVLDWLPLRGRK